MRILVPHTWPEAPLETVALPEPLASASPQSVLYLPLPRRFEPEELDGLINVEWRRAAQLVVLRAHPTDVHKLAPGTFLRRQLEHRFENRPLCLITWSTDRHTLRGAKWTGDLAPAWFTPGVLIRACRTAELKMLTLRPGAFLPPSQGFHYIGPNGSHYNAFLRVGTGLQSLDVLDGLAFWLLPYLRTRPMLLLDSWTTIALGLNCSRYLSEIGFGEVQLQIEYLHSYLESPGAVAARLISVLGSRRPSASILFILSVTSTGRLARAVLAECLKAGLGPIKVLSLFADAEQPHPEAGSVLCALQNELDDDLPAFARFDAEACPRCNSGTPAVRIEPTTYFLEVCGACNRD
jgi:hypothetical protein